MACANARWRASRFPSRVPCRTCSSASAVAGSSAKRNSARSCAVDHAVANERLEVDHLVPVRRPVEHDRNAPLDLLGLHQRQDLGELVERAEAAGKHDERAGEMREPELAHEEVVELEGQPGRDVGIGPLLVRQPDVEPDRLAARVGGAAVGGLHDAAAAARAHDAVADLRRKLHRPQRDEARQLARVVVVAAERPVGSQARGSEEHDRAADLLALERVQRLQVLGEDAQRPRVVAVEERLVLVRERGARDSVGVHAVSRGREIDEAAVDVGVEELAR